jgi:hypothetical protein
MHFALRLSVAWLTGRGAGLAALVEPGGRIQNAGGGFNSSTYPRPEEDGSWSYEAPCGLGAALGGVIGREPEIWKVTVGTVPAADLDGEVKTLLSRRSVSPSSPSWR